MTEADVVEDLTQFLCAEQGWRRLRNESGFIPGAGSYGEKGIPDYQFIRYLATPGNAIVMWIEAKSPTHKPRCSCRARHKDERGRTKPAHICRECGQKLWAEREAARGALVLKVSDVEEFKRWYKRTFDWLPAPVMGQQQKLFEGTA